MEGFAKLSVTIPPYKKFDTTTSADASMSLHKMLGQTYTTEKNNIIWDITLSESERKCAIQNLNLHNIKLLPLGYKKIAIMLAKLTGLPSGLLPEDE